MNNEKYHSYVAVIFIVCSDTVIDIYTITGHKIDDPSQLIHQAAYVAVKPPTAFIQTGYENYLIRATR